MSENQDWDPAQYDRFREERQQPFHDLLRLVRPRSGMRVVDLGCGTGELTRHAHRQLKASATIGIDASAAMLDKTREIEEPGLSFRLGFIEDYSAQGDVDLILSNAALHWVDHTEEQIARFFQALAPRGQLAIQVPFNLDQPTHVTANEIAAREPFVSALRGHGVLQHVPSPTALARVLHRIGFREQNVHLRVYGHRLGSRDDVVEWVKGSLLVDFRRRLDDSLYERFVEEYRAALMQKLPDERPFFFPFQRLFAWAER